jgi:ribosomal protein L37AE/L43A
MSDWWGRKLGVEPQPSSTPPVRTPAPAPYRPSTVPGYRQQVQYNAEQDVVTTKAQHVQNAHSCPGCGSGNYMKNPGSNYYRCFDCGYPITQSTSGLGGSHDASTPIQAAQQVSGSGYNPGQIVGRID